MIVKFDDGTPITLEQMLLAKEKRVANQLFAITHYQQPIISLCLVIPGAIKNSSGAHYLFNQAIQALHHCLSTNNITIVNEQHYDQITGFEAIISVACQTEKLKQFCIDIEDNHPLGRLWDIDVIDPTTQQSLSRAQFEQRPRQCLVCDEVAKICGRAKRHSLDEIFTAIQNKIIHYGK